jgi:hypothetical protein
VKKRVSELHQDLFQSEQISNPYFHTRMRIFRALGLGVFLLVLANAMPEVFHALEATVLAFLHATQTVFEQAETFTASPSQLQLMVPRVSY